MKPALIKENTPHALSLDRQRLCVPNNMQVVMGVRGHPIQRTMDPVALMMGSGEALNASSPSMVR